MADFGIDAEGGIDDRIRIQLGDDEIRIVETYEVSQRVFTQPAAFAIRIGHGGTTKALTDRFPPNTRYRLFVGSVLQHSGRTDGFAPADAGGATELNLPGRCGLAPLHDVHAVADQSFGSISYRELTKRCLEAAGIRDFTLSISNEADRRIRAGVPVRTTRPTSRVVVTIVSSPFEDPLVTKARLAEALAAEKKKVANENLVAQYSGPKPPSSKALKIKTGKTWYSFLHTELERAGLFLFSGVGEGSFILAQPHANQAPTYRLVRQRGTSINAVNVLKATHRNVTTGRHAEYVIYGRGGGGKAGRTKTIGTFIDEEMRSWGFTKTFAAVDDDAKSVAQAEHLARCKCAAARRAGWELVYTVRGHTAPSRVGGGRAVWTPDTIVEVIDDEYGISGLFWIEGVTFRGGPQGRTTELALTRPSDLVFGDGSPDT